MPVPVTESVLHESGNFIRKQKAPPDDFSEGLFVCEPYVRFLPTQSIIFVLF
jgi:hypothetical protein